MPLEAAVRRQTRVVEIRFFMATTIQVLRDEGVLEVGGVAGTSVVYVITRTGAHLFHAAELPPRRLDAYGTELAVHWIEMGASTRGVALDLGVTEVELRRSLLAAGHARMSPAQLAALAVKRGRRKVGNRRGRLVRVSRVGMSG